MRPCVFNPLAISLIGKLDELEVSAQSGRASVSDLEQRVSDLEAEVAALKDQLKDT